MNIHLQIKNELKNICNLKNINFNIILFNTVDNNSPIYGSTIPRYFEKEKIPDIIVGKLETHNKNSFPHQYQIIGNEYDEEVTSILLNVDDNISFKNYIHTYVHEFIHVLQYELEFNDNHIPNNKHHNSNIWNKYSELLGLHTIGDYTDIRTNGIAYELVEKYG